MGCALKAVWARSGRDGSPGKVWLVDPAGPRTEFATGLERPVGLACTGHGLYVSERGQITSVRELDGDGRADSHGVFVDNLPASVLHQNNGLVWGPGGQLFVGQGSATDADVNDPPNNSILSMNDSGHISVYATGFRNPFGLAWMDGALYATDIGIDPPLVEASPEELDRVEAGQFYGHPYWVGDERSLDGGPAATSPAVMFTPHASANGVTAAGSQMWSEHSR
jgi:glucose/arabinose dehydrogenase